MRLLHLVLVLHLTILALTHPCFASDHADPIDLLRWSPLDPVITDLFVFPVDEAGELVDGVQDPISDLVVILCVRRGLTDTESLKLSPYTYTVQMDTTSLVTFSDDPDDLSRPRYGGSIPAPESIRPDVKIAMRLNDDATLDERTIVGLVDPDSVPPPITGVFADPFIFPMFEQSNVVGMVLRIPMTCFRDDPKTFIVWATSRKGRRQIDHVGRSLRTQNPRFDLLNTLPPKDHVNAIKSEHESPGLMRDIALRFNLESLFGYRKWDYVPDVLIYSRDHAVGFPNGRRLRDDVVALLAEHGDTLTFELSYFEKGPRKTENDLIQFRDKPPYLAPAHADPAVPEPHSLSIRTMLIIGAIIGAIALGLFVLHLWLRNRYYWKKHRRRYL